MDVRTEVVAALRGRALFWSTESADVALGPDGCLRARPRQEAPLLWSFDGAWGFLPDPVGAAGELVALSDGRRHPLPRLHLGARRALGFVDASLLCCESTAHVRTYQLHRAEGRARASAAYAPCADGEHVDWEQSALELVARVDGQESVVTLALPSFAARSQVHWSPERHARRLHSEGGRAWIILDHDAGYAEVWALRGERTAKLASGLRGEIEAVYAAAPDALWLGCRRPERTRICDMHETPTDLVRVDLRDGRHHFVSESLPREYGARLLDVKHAGRYFALLYSEAASFVLFIIDESGQCLRTHRFDLSSIPDVVLSPEGTAALMLDPPHHAGDPYLELIPTDGAAAQVPITEGGCELRFAED